LSAAGARGNAQRIVTFDVPGADMTANSYGGTHPGTINIDGTVTGNYLDAKGVYRGFVRESDGHITTFDAPGADLTNNGSHGTSPVSINDLGAIAGYYANRKGNYHGFIRTCCGNHLAHYPRLVRIDTQTLAVLRSCQRHFGHLGSSDFQTSVASDPGARGLNTELLCCDRCAGSAAGQHNLSAISISRLSATAWFSFKQL